MTPECTRNTGLGRYSPRTMCRFQRLASIALAQSHVVPGGESADDWPPAAQTQLIGLNRGEDMDRTREHSAPSAVAVARDRTLSTPTIIRRRQASARQLQRIIGLAKTPPQQRHQRSSTPNPEPSRPTTDHRTLLLQVSSHGSHQR